VENNWLQIAEALCKRFEGLYLRPYSCPAGVATVGYGATYYLDGRKVTLKDSAITKQEAERMLRWLLLNEYGPAVDKLCPGLTGHKKAAAIVDFAFNLGIGRLRGSTLRRRINAGDFEAAKIEIMKWNKAGGRVLRGLTLRRIAERDLL
jgi:lysozyme